MKSLTVIKSNISKQNISNQTVIVCNIFKQCNVLEFTKTLL